MGIWDIFSGESGRNTAIWSAQNTQAGADQQRRYLGTGAEQSLAALGAGDLQARSDLYGGNYGAQSALTQGLQGGYANLAGAQDTYRAYGASADAMYNPVLAGANAGYSAYGDAAGANGAAGQARARQNFQTGPGYGFARDEAVNAATRGAGAAGMAASGNTMDSLSRLGSNLANQEWGNYMNRLSPYLNLATGIAQQRAGLQGGIGASVAGTQKDMAGLTSGWGKDQAGMATGYGGALASLASGLGTKQAGLYSDLSRNLSNVTGAENAAITGQGQAGLMAGQTANQNTWNAGIQIADILASNANKISKAFA
jgi:hypothetical protein